jgi:osmoprotectant transport system ATP-binding protein
MIRFEHVRKVYRGKSESVAAVDDLSLEIEEGELCIFLGPSGCGKTTSLKLINRLVPLSSGAIYIDGVSIMDLNPNELRRGVGYAIQNIGLFPHFTVQENIATVPVLKKWAKSRQRDRAAELLSLVGMPPEMFLDRYPSELSGGQQQRVGVARCLGADPPILLMDEPFGAIDPITRNKLQDEFLNIQAKIRKTIVFVTHDIDEAIKMGDKIALMRTGKLEQFGDPSELLYTPRNEFVRNFVGSDHYLKGLKLMRVRDVMREAPVTVTIDEGVTQARLSMEKQGMTWAMVVDRDRHFLGWITHEDAKPGMSLQEVFEPSTVTAELSTPLNVALSMMLHSAIGNLAVLDESDRLAGVVSFQTIRDVVGAQMDSTNGSTDEGAPSQGEENPT